MILQTFKSIESFISSIGYSLLDKFGCGAYGCAFAIVNKDNEHVDVLKLTQDGRENYCAERLLATQAWNKTKHLPIIYSIGGPIIVNETITKAWTEHGKDVIQEVINPFIELNYYIREELSDIPFEFWNNPKLVQFGTEQEMYDETWNLTTEAQAAKSNIETKTGLCLPDAHMENWGFRPDDLEAFVKGKTKEIPPYVLRDLSCYACIR